MMIELFHRPIPAWLFEPSRQPTGSGISFKNRHFVPRFTQVICRCHPAKARPDYRDFHEPLSCVVTPGSTGVVSLRMVSLHLIPSRVM